MASVYIYQTYIQNKYKLYKLNINQNFSPAITSPFIVIGSLDLK